MDSRSRSRSLTPRSRGSRYTRSSSPARSGRGRSYTRSASPASRGNGRYRSRSRSDSRDRSVSRRRGRSESPLRGSTKIVVERLTKTINEDHLREIFGEYGRIRDLDLPMNKQFNTNRGTAYILFEDEADAEAAIAHMHEAQIDGSVINVSIVLPRRKFSPSPPTASRGANIDPRQPAPRGPAGDGFRAGRGGGGGGGGARRRRGPQGPPSPRHGGHRGGRGAPRGRSRSVESYRSRSRSPSKRRAGGQPREGSPRNNYRRTPSPVDYPGRDGSERARSDR